MRARNKLEYGIHVHYAHIVTRKRSFKEDDNKNVVLMQDIEDLKAIVLFRGEGLAREPLLLPPLTKGARACKATRMKDRKRKLEVRNISSTQMFLRNTVHRVSDAVNGTITVIYR